RFRVLISYRCYRWNVLVYLHRIAHCSVVDARERSRYKCAAARSDSTNDHCWPTGAPIITAKSAALSAPHEVSHAFGSQRAPLRMPPRSLACEFFWSPLAQNNQPVRSRDTPVLIWDIEVKLTDALRLTAKKS